jgi:hypothetical protein
MYASKLEKYSFAAELRWLARTSAEIIAVLWTGYFVVELYMPDNAKWPLDLLAQGAILAVIFAGYVIGWRHELVGGWLAILGTVALVAAMIIFYRMRLDSLYLAWFSLPGVLFLMARHYDRRLANPNA